MLQLLSLHFLGNAHLFRLFLSIANVRLGSLLRLFDMHGYISAVYLWIEVSQCLSHCRISEVDSVPIIVHGHKSKLIVPLVISASLTDSCHAFLVR